MTVPPGRGLPSEPAADQALDLVTEETAAGVLGDLGLVAPGSRVRTHALSGGISNIVLAVEWEGGRAVLKQSLPRLRVATEWTFDRSRIVNERRALEHLRQLLPTGAIPAVLGHDDARFLFVMAHAADGGEVWKDQLLAGRVDPVTAWRVGKMLGDIHSGTAGDPVVAARFGDSGPLVQGRVDPYHRTAAARNPQVAEIVLAEADRLLATRTALVLGDWSPKNLIVYDDHVVALDFEVAHLGDPAFDVAFMLTHLTLKSLHLPRRAAALRRAADAFVQAYTGAAGSTAPPDEHVVLELGCLLLARVDGKSPAEYLAATDHDRVRDLAVDVLRRPERPLSATLDRLIAS